MNNICKQKIGHYIVLIIYSSSIMKSNKGAYRIRHIIAMSNIIYNQI